MASALVFDHGIGPDFAAWRPSGRARFVSAAAVVALHVLIGVLLAQGFGVTLVRTVGADLKIFDVRELPPPAPAQIPPSAKARSDRAEKPEGASAPPAPRASPPPVVAPVPVVPLPVPPPLRAAPNVGQGNRIGGQSNLAGVGSGSGGQGSGTGSGAAGSGPGGGGEGIATHASRIKGEIRGSDYPRSAYAAHAEGTTFTRLVIAADGRVRECTIDELSGNADLDAATCALILRRFRYRPARDAQGRPVEETLFRAQVWETRERF